MTIIFHKKNISSSKLAEAIATGGTVQTVADAGSSLELDPNIYSGADAVLTEACNVSFAEITVNGDEHTFTLKARQDSTGSRDITWASNIDWDSDTEPSPDATGSTYALYGFVTMDGGTSWLGSMIASGVPLS